MISTAPTPPRVSYKRGHWQHLYMMKSGVSKGKREKRALLNFRPNK